ncbi:CBS domain-containing protein [Prosthecomicrobium pneumaticum]|uniref:CBS domain-containing protein n=1 Tax=Prosthecomicrobium pneumaticum TaxID=81895 RepID=A0A7W9CTD0_9HYPH|nr:CBS domain-containing protein [Prosthecomicrobium pneumaticum]MBB5751299.1 CBS domain-containing protein [Prosthecomicrobium pneumaticum]
MRVEAVMTSPVVSVERATPIADAARLMLANEISGLPVVSSEGALVGIVSEGDFLRRGELGTERKRPRWLEFLAGPGRLAEDYVRSHGRHVDEVMTEAVATVTPDTPLEDAVEIMAKRRIKRLPVVAGGRLIGIVTRSDLLRALTAALPADAAPTDDRRIRAAIEAQLDKADWLGNGLIRVAVADGTVTLDGAIFDERQRQAARVLAENVPGVKSVVDQLVWIEPMSGFVVMPPEGRPIG